MKSLYGKLVFGFLISIFFAFSLAGYVSTQNHRERLEELTVNRITESAQSLVNLPLEAGGMESYARATGIGIAVVHGDQVDYYGTEMAGLTDDKILDMASSPGAQKDGESMFYAAPAAGGATLVLRKSMHEENRIFEQSLMYALGSIFICGTVVFLIIANFIVKPVQRLTRATKELTKGNYNVEVKYRGHDELAVLAESFNTMARRLLELEENRQKFISDVSHEFQTPLTSIQGFAKILKSEEISSEQRTRYANIILEQSKRLSILSKNMMQLTLLENDDIRLEKSRYSLTAQLAAIVEMQTVDASRKNLDLVTDFPKSDVMIVADKDRMEQVFINLISNAIKYTMEGVITVRLRRSLKEIEVQVEDTGIGLTPEAQNHIFDRFYRADKSRSIQGNGLGLAIVKRIIDLHGFKINVQSQPDVGSIFSVIIPGEGIHLTMRGKNQES